MMNMKERYFSQSAAWSPCAAAERKEFFFFKKGRENEGKLINNGFYCHWQAALHYPHAPQTLLQKPFGHIARLALLDFCKNVFTSWPSLAVHGQSKLSEPANIINSRRLWPSSWLDGELSLMCGDGCDVVLVVYDYRQCSLLHLIKISKNYAAFRSESCVLAALNIKCVLYTRQLWCRVCKSKQLCIVRTAIIFLDFMQTA